MQGPSRQHGDGPSDAPAPPAPLDPTADAPQWAALTDYGHIGSYRILEKVGEGGMGVVYRAEQRVPVRRIVALKVIKLGMDSKEVIARFEAERQALAMMNHPNVAKVVDAGMTEQGRPYFAMEFVAGIPLTRYCDENKLNTKERLELFISVCHAVQHAHQKGIIHRDLKPTNILVTMFDGKPVPKVIDFGIAKAANQALTPHTLYTRTGAMVGTPEYMSPEQAMTSGLDVDTRTDIYSLGVILYELITGSLPFDPTTLHQGDLEQMAKAIKEIEPRKPSTHLSLMATQRAPALQEVARRHRTDPRSLQRELKGDLDWITLKAMEKDRTRRYETANGLAMDIQRHLENEPVQARPPSTLYRFGKLMRRYRAVAAASALIAVALLLGMIGTSIGLVRARVALSLAHTERQRADLARTDAEAQKVIAVDSQKKAESAQEIAEQQSYLAQISLVNQLIGGGRIDRATSALLECPPKYRGWEWGRLLYLCNQDIFTAKIYGASQLSFSKDNRRLAARGRFGRSGESGETLTPESAVVWDIESGKELWRSSGGAEEVISAVALSPNGQLLALATADRTVRLIDPAGGNLKLRLADFPTNVIELAFSDDSARFLTRTEDVAYSFWDVGSGQALTKGLKPLDGEINKSPWNHSYSLREGKAVLLVTIENRVKAWDLLSGSQIASATLPGSASATRVLSAAALRILSNESDKPVEMWDVATSQNILLLDAPTRARYLGFSQDGEQCWVIGEEDRIQRIFDVRSGRQIASAPAEHGVSDHSHQNRLFLASDFANTVKYWGLDGKVTEIRGHDGRINGVKLSSDGSRIVTVGSEGTLKVWATSSGRSAIPDAAWTYAAAYSPDGRLIATTNDDVEMRQTTVRIWEAASGRLRHALQGHLYRTLDIAFSPDGRHLASVGLDGRLRIWDVEQGREVRVIQAHERATDAVAYSPDGRLIATGSFDRVARIWDAQTGQRILELPGHSNKVRDVKFSPDGRFLATAGFDGTVVLWEMPSGRRLRTLIHSPGAVYCLAFSPDGNLIAASCNDKSIAIWEIATGKPVHAFKTRTSMFNIAFTPDGRRIVAACSEGSSLSGYPSVDLFDVKSGREMLSLTGHRELLTALAVAPDGLTIASGGTDENIRQWEAFPWREEEYPAPGKPFAERVRAYAAEYWRARLSAQRLAAEAPRVPILPMKVPASAYAARDPDTRFDSIDLSAHYNAPLNVSWIYGGNPSNFDLQFSQFPAGLVSIGGVEFDVRGVVQLAQQFQWSRKNFPSRVENIKILRHAHRIHFLHGQLSDMPRGTHVGSYVLHYSDGSRQEFKLESERDLFTIWRSGAFNPAMSRAHVAWDAQHPDSTNYHFRLYKSIWRNPTPEKQIVSVDFESWGTGAGPLLVALTVEPTEKTLDSDLAELDRQLLALRNDGSMLHRRAQVHLGLRQFTQAADDYAKAIAIRPDSARWRREYSDLLLNLGRLDEAAAQLAAAQSDGQSLPAPLLRGQWWLLGPFSPRLQSNLPPDAIDPLKPVTLGQNTDRVELRWQPTGEWGSLVNIGQQVHDVTDVRCYVQQRIYSPSAREVMLRLHLNETGKVWLNGKLVQDLTRKDERLVPFRVQLDAGWNTLLARVQNPGGAYGIQAELSADVSPASMARRQRGHFDWALLRRFHEPDLNVLYRRAKYHAICNQLQEAAAGFDALIALRPQRYSFHHRRALLYLTMGDLGGYQRACAQLIKLFGDCDEPNMAQEMALTCLAGDLPAADTQAAIDMATRAFERGNKTAAFQMTKGVAEYRAGKPREALNTFVKVQESQISNRIQVITDLYIALTQQKLGQIKEAQQALERAAETIELKNVALGMPDLTFDFDHYAIIEVTRRDAERVLGPVDVSRFPARLRELRLAELTKTIDQGAPSRTNLRDRAKLYLQAAKFQEALADYTRVVELYPSDHFDWYLRGQMLAFLGQQQAYAEHCKAAFEKFSKDQDPYVLERMTRLCALLPQGGGDAAQILEMAARSVQKLTEQNSSNMDWVLLAKGLAEYRLGNFDAAIEDLNKCRASYSSSRTPIADLILAMAYHKLGRASEAASAMAKGVEGMNNEMPGLDSSSFRPQEWLTGQVIAREAAQTLGRRAQPQDGGDSPAETREK